MRGVAIFVARLQDTIRHVAPGRMESCACRPLSKGEGDQEWGPPSPTALSDGSEGTDAGEAQQATDTAQRSWIMSYMEAQSDDDGSDASVRGPGARRWVFCGQGTLGLGEQAQQDRICLKRPFIQTCNHTELGQAHRRKMQVSGFKSLACVSRRLGLPLPKTTRHRITLRRGAGELARRLGAAGGRAPGGAAQEGES